MPAFENLRIHMVHGENSKTAAFVSCKILTEAGALFLNSMALVRGANGLYLSFPSRKREGQPVKGFEDYYYMERGLKELVQATAIEEFKKRCAELGVDPEKAGAPLPPGAHGGEEEREERAPREFHEPQPFRNESRPAFGPQGGYEGGYEGGFRGPGGGFRGGQGGGFRGGQGGGFRGGQGGGFRGGYEGGGQGGGFRGNRGGGRGDDFGNRGGGGRGGYRGDDFGNRGGGGRGGYRGDDFGNRGGGRGDDFGNRNNFGFPTGPNLANRPLSSRFNPYTGNGDLQPEKPSGEAGRAGKDQKEKSEEPENI